MKYFLFFPIIFAACSPLKTVQKSSAAKLVDEVYQVRRKNPDIREGRYTQYYKGVKITEGSFMNNEKSGEWQYHDYAGKLYFKGSYQAGKKTGKWSYYINQSLISELFYKNNLVDSINSFYENETKASVLRYDSLRNGYCNYYYSNGNLREHIPLEKGLIHGVYQSYFEDGRLHRETEYRRSWKWTVLKTLDASGQETPGGTLKDGNGTQILYYLPDEQTGKILAKSSEINYKEGRKEGPCTDYMRNGDLRRTGQFENNRQAGEWKIYEKGRLKTTFIFNNEEYTSLDKIEPAYYYGGSDIEEENEETAANSNFPGGEIERVSFITKNVIYPQKDRINGTEGTVYIQFVTSPTGEIGSFKIIKGVTKEIDDEVIRILKLMPRLHPKLFYGIPTSTYFNMPLKFRLK